MSEVLTIQAQNGPYEVRFEAGPLVDAAPFTSPSSHVIVDANVARLYAGRLGGVLSKATTIQMDATEDSKSLQALVPLFERLIANGLRRDHTLVAIGGGIVQDATCFVASTVLRGVAWQFAPTTLLAQADSCIGSKSSINLGGRKNLLGTFYPPSAVFVDSTFLGTLERKDIRSGIGEIAKVHAIEGRDAFDRFAADFDRLFAERPVLDRYVYAALRIKQRFIEADEFDRGIRNIFNYGHSFGHAIESATHYRVPHGIAVAMGIDTANALAVARDLTPRANYGRMHAVLHKLYTGYTGLNVAVDEVVAALMADKKNTTSALGLILPVGPEARIERLLIERDDRLMSQVRAAISGVFA